MTEENPFKPPSEGTSIESDLDPFRNEGSTVGGIFLALGIPIFFLFTAVIPVWGSVVVFSLMGIGLVQLLYVIPLVRHYKRKGLTSTVQGIWIGAGIVFLLNSACLGMFFSAFN